LHPQQSAKPLPILANALIGLRVVCLIPLPFDEMLNAPLLMQPTGADGEARRQRR